MIRLPPKKAGTTPAMMADIDGTNPKDSTSEIQMSIVAFLLLPACQFLPTDDKTTSVEDTSVEDTSVEDTSVEDTSVEDTSTEDTATDPGNALIRFVNLSDGDQARFLIDDLSGGDLYFSQSADYQTFKAGIHDVSAVNPANNSQIYSNLIGYEFEAGKKYTVAAMGLHMGHPNIWVNVDVAADATDVPADHSRLTLVNATPDTTNSIYAQLQYGGNAETATLVDFYEINQRQLLGFVQQVTTDVPFGTGFIALSAQWGVPAVYDHYWNGAALTQVANNESLYVFLTCQGSCNSNEDRVLLGLLEDSSTFTVEDLF